MDDVRFGAPGAPPPDGLHEALLDWFDRHRRDLPWRRRRSLYGTWISEMMLQQTTVATVVPYWERFLARYPDVATLAAAPEDEVLASWSGLGYYRRARQLLAAARQVVADRGGELPRDADSWRALPGVGPYAAGAIASIGLGLPEPAVDANVRRVLGRWYGAGGTLASSRPAALAAAAAALLPPGRAGDWNEALMELGATVCLPRRPLCTACPAAGHCRSAGTEGEPGGSPARPRAAAVGLVLVIYVSGGRPWLEAAGGQPLACETCLVPAREEFGRLHQGLLGLPMTAWYALPGAAAGHLPAVAALAAGVEGLPGRPARLGTVRHAITRFRLLAAVLVVDLEGPAPPFPVPGRPDGRWLETDLAEDIHLSQLTRKALRLFPR